ncbi:MAG: hypothetical protein H7095_02090 [Pseudopedobacter sp.]|nr:hypothetical protein [Deinococcales bacterium]
MSFGPRAEPKGEFMLLSCGVLSALWAVLFGVRSGVALSYLLCGMGVA